MRLHLLVLSATCAAGACAVQPPPAAPRPLPPAPLRVVTWNVHDLFDAVDRLAPPGDLDGLPSPLEVEERLRAVAAVLVRIDADVALLQEVENLGVALELAERAGYPEARLVDGNDPRGIDVAVLSRLPVDRYVSHLGEVASDGRPLWSRDCVELHAGGGRLVAVATHLVSRISDPTGARRGEQAARLREIVDGVARTEPGALVLGGGDLNDEPSSAPLSPLLADGEWTDPLAELGLADAWTWLGGGGGARLDYLLLPRRSAWLVIDAGVAEGADVSAASDHRPLVLDVAWGR